MNSVVWVIQGLVTLVFLASGVPKLVLPKATLEQRMSWVYHVPLPAVKAIGALEMLGAVGLIMPALTGLLPWLTPLAAAGLMLMMIGAIAIRLQLREYGEVLAPAIFLVLTAFIAYARFVLAPI